MVNMEIKFLSCKKEPVSYSFDYDYSYACVTSQKELDGEEEGFLPIPKVALSMKKILERNSDFKDFIREVNAVIPYCPFSMEDLDWDGVPSDITCISPQEIALEIWSELEKKHWGREKIIKKYNVHADLEEHLPFLIKAHALMAPFCPSEFGIDFERGEGLYGHIERRTTLSNVLSINIGVKTSVNKIIANLKYNKKILDKYLNQLDVKPWYISKKALEIYDLREKGKKFREVADIIEGKYDSVDSYDGQTNENSVKKSYTRTDKVIKSMFSKK